MNRKFTSIKKELPCVYETGSWDGKRSDLVVLKLDNDEYAIGRLYSGFIDGSEFNDWYNSDDMTLNGNVIEWANLPE